MLPTAIGASINVSDSAALAALSLDGLTVGTQVWNIDVGAYFKLTQSVRTNITLLTTDGYVSPAWTLANATFTGFEGCTLALVLQAPNVAFSKGYVIDTVSSATVVHVVDPPAGATAGELFGSAVLYSDALVTDSVVDANGVTGLRWVIVVDSAGITQLTGNVTAGPGSGSVVATIAPAVVTNAMMVTEAAATIKGRALGAGTGAVTDLTANQARDITNTSTHIIIAPAGSAGAPSVQAGTTLGTGLFGSGAAVGIASAQGTVLSVAASQVDTFLRAVAGNTNIGANVNAGTLATNATSGFMTIPTCAGTPIGAPTVASGFAALVVDTSAGKLWAFYGAAWHDLTGV